MEKKFKEKKQKEWRVPKRRQPIFGIFGKIFRPLFKAKVESVIETLPDKAIIVSIHAAKNGPMAISLNYPKFHCMWGHHDMLGGYITRYKYLRNVLYIQKMHKGKLSSTIKPIYEAAFSKWIYRGMKVIGTYTDMRFITTIRKSMAVLDEGASVVVFPEDSAEGYFDEVRAGFPGFVMLAAAYFSECGEDVPVIPAYISTEKKRFILGAPKYVHELELSGKSKQDIANELCEDINALYRDYIATDKPLPTIVKDAPARPRGYYGEKRDDEL